VKILKKTGRDAAVTHVLGYVADSGNAEFIRLYFNLDFDKYVEIRKSDILHTEDAPPDVIELGGTYVWIRKDAECKYVEVQSSTIKADFLSGDISSTFLRPQTARPPIRYPGVGYATRSWECNTVSWPCPALPL
jgi:hypothetical protein